MGVGSSTVAEVVFYYDGNNLLGKLALDWPCVCGDNRGGSGGQGRGVHVIGDVSNAKRGGGGGGWGTNFAPNGATEQGFITFEFISSP